MPEAGWYTDPHDSQSLRWWDGQAWGAATWQPEAKTHKAGGSKAPLVIVGIAVAMTLALALTQSGDDDGSDTAAFTACTQFVEDRLKSPATADFEGMGYATITNTGQAWTVRSHVDSENGFGATVRTEFVCKMKYTESGDWLLTDLRTDD